MIRALASFKPDEDGAENTMAKAGSLSRSETGKFRHGEMLCGQ